MAEEDLALVRDEARQHMESPLRSLRADLQKVRTGRASTGLLDGIHVDYYGTPTPLNQLANMTVPDPRLIVISPYDKGSISAIEKAIQKSDLGLTPSNDGKVVRIPIPPLTEERRKDSAQVHKLAEHHKVGVREGRRDALAMLKDLESDGSATAGRAPPRGEEDPGPDRRVRQEDRRADPAQGSTRSSRSEARSARGTCRKAAATRVHSAPRRHHHGRQRALGGEPRPLAHRGPPRGHGGRARRAARGARARRPGAHPLRLLDRELEPARRPRSTS